MIIENQQGFNALMKKYLVSDVGKYISRKELKTQVSELCEDYETRKRNYADYIEFYFSQHNVSPLVRSKIGQIDESSVSDDQIADNQVFLDHSWVKPVQIDNHRRKQSWFCCV